MSWFDDNELRRAVDRALAREFGGPDHEAAVARVRRAVSRYIAQQPEFPLLVGTTDAARILKIQPTHISRLRKQGRMPPSVPVEGSNYIYLRSEVEELAKEIANERRERAARRS